MTKRRNTPVFLTMPPAERDALAAFALEVNRPMSWVVRDALKAYLSAVKSNPDALDRIKGQPYALKVDVKNIPAAEPQLHGRPAKTGSANA